MYEYCGCAEMFIAPQGILVGGGELLYGGYNNFSFPQLQVDRRHG